MKSSLWTSLAFSLSMITTMALAGNSEQDEKITGSHIKRKAGKLNLVPVKILRVDDSATFGATSISELLGRSQRSVTNQKYKFDFRNKNQKTKKEIDTNEQI